MHIVFRHQSIGVSDDFLDDGEGHSGIGTDGDKGVAKRMKADVDLGSLVGLAFDAGGNSARDEVALNLSCEKSRIVLVEGRQFGKDESFVFGWQGDKLPEKAVSNRQRNRFAISPSGGFVGGDGDDSSEKVNGSPIHRGTVAKPEPSVNSKGEEGLQFAGCRSKDADELFGGQFSLAVGRLLFLMNVFPWVDGQLRSPF